MKTMKMKQELLKSRHMFGVFASMFVFAAGAVALRFTLFAPELMSAAF